MNNNGPLANKNNNRTTYNNRHFLSSSDPPLPPPAKSNSFLALDSLNLFRHTPRRSEDGLLSMSRGASTTQAASHILGRSATIATSPTSLTGSFAPSSFHAHSTSTSFSRHVLPGTVSTSQTKLTSNILPSRSNLATPSASRSSSLSRRNGPTPGLATPAVEPTALASGMQRINMKRLMSKPTAIQVPDRAHSAMAFASIPTDTESMDCEQDEEEEHLHVRSRSLDILRRSKRRSRSVDLMMTASRPSDQPDLVQLSPNESIGSGPTSFHAAWHQSSTRGLTRSPSTPTTARPAVGPRSRPEARSAEPGPSPNPKFSSSPPKYLQDRSEAHNAKHSQHASAAATASPMPSPAGLLNLSPASVIALAWTESQKRANRDISQRNKGKEPTASFAAHDIDAATYTSISPVLFADADLVRRRRSVSDQYPSLIVHSANDEGVFTQSPQEEVDPVMITSIPEKKRDHAASPSPSPSPSALRSETVVSRLSIKGGRVDNTRSVSATMREVSRRFTGAFVGLGKEKKQINQPSTSFSTSPFIPNSEPMGSTPPSSFNAKPVSKASLSHDLRARSFSRTRSKSKSDTGKGCMFEFKMDQIESELYPQLHDQPFSLSHHPTEFGQLEQHTPLQTGINTYSGTSLTRRDHPPETQVAITPIPHLPPLEMPGWLLPVSAHRNPSDSEDHHSQELILSRQTSTGSHLTSAATSPRSPAHSEQGHGHGKMITTPTRSSSITPNTLKKRSRPNLRKPPSSFALVSPELAPAFAPGGMAPLLMNPRPEQHSTTMTVTTTTTTLHRHPQVQATALQQHTEEAASSSSGQGQGAGGKLRGLVKKLSSGALRRSASQSDKANNSPPLLNMREGHSHGHGHGGGGTSSFAELPPPVPQIPKDFEMILDVDAYFAERAKLREERVDSSDGESAPGTGPTTTLRVPGMRSQVSSRRSSLLGRKEQTIAAAPPATDVPSSLPSSFQSRLRVDTEVDMFASTKRTSASLPPPRRHQQTPTQPPGAYAFPKRSTNAMTDHGSSGYSQTEHFGLEYRSSSPSLSSADLHVHRLYAAAASSSFEKRTSLSSHSHSHELASVHSHTLIAQPIMAPKELFQHGEDEAAMLRRLQNKDNSGNRGVSKRRSFNQPGGTSANHSAEQSPITPPPPLLSPLVCLTIFLVSL